MINMEALGITLALGAYSLFALILILGVISFMEKMHR
jgi:hypothetical protein